MRKRIDFPPYDEAEVRQINEDGSALCDLYGDGISDRDIVFPAGSAILGLTEAEVASFAAAQQTEID